MRNYYLVLGLKDFSNNDTIKAKYRKLAKLYHPDKNPDNPKALSKFQEIAEAYEVLSNPSLKQQLDDFLMGKFVAAKRKSPEQRRAEARARAHALKVKHLEMRFQAYQNSLFSTKRRIMMAYFLMLVTFFLFVFNFFPNLEHSGSVFLLAFLGLCFAAFIYLFVDAYYLSQAYKHRHRPFDLQKLLKRSSYIFIALFFGTPILGAATAHLRKKVLLTYNNRVTTPIEISKNRTEHIWRVKFYANFEVYSCTVNATGFEHLKEKEIRVAYYPSDPRLCKLAEPATP